MHHVPHVKEVDAVYAFARTRVPLGLIGEQGALASRAGARRVAARLQNFRHAAIDFSGISSVCHGFADELFRVFGREHARVVFDPVGMRPRVAAMLESVRGY